MRIRIVSDLHANLEALAALPEDFDHLWVLGDLVNYGPDPAAAIQYVRQRASVVVRGNHDHAIASGEDPRCSARFRRMAEETSRYTRSMLGPEEIAYLRGLPLTAEIDVSGTRFQLCHAAPADPLYEYRPPDSDRWHEERWPGILLVGHTHLPFQRAEGGTTVVNPGSLGQAKHGRSEACYATWEDGKITLSAVPYDVERTVDKLRRLPLSTEVVEDLAFVLRNGRAA